MTMRAIVTILLILLFAAPQARAETVTLDRQGLTLLGNVEGDLAAERFVVLVHGTLAHKDMELIDALQTALAERDVASLAISLSFSLSNREGMYDCA